MLKSFLNGANTEIDQSRAQGTCEEDTDSKWSKTKTCTTNGANGIMGTSKSGMVVEIT